MRTAGKGDDPVTFSRHGGMGYPIRTHWRKAAYCGNIAMEEKRRVPERGHVREREDDEMAKGIDMGAYIPALVGIEAGLRDMQGYLPFVWDKSERDGFRVQLYRDLRRAKLFRDACERNFTAFLPDMLRFIRENDADGDHAEAC